MKSLHKTTASYKPSVGAKNEIKNEIGRNTQGINLTSSVNCNNNPKMEVLYEERIELMQKAYDEKIEELMTENQRLVNHISVLKRKN